MTTSIERIGDQLCADDHCELSAQKMMGVALLGALGSLTLYYIYMSLGDDTREAIKENITAALKQNLNKLTQ
ncbi:MAG: hypothetical protein FJX76_01680 [Armatimonadetes bacterium]|nr:hypothetical protein [Armatimonadota bacterium]